MSKITTDDCKNFLVEYCKRNPSVVSSVFYTVGKHLSPDEEIGKKELISWSIDSRLWTRRSKYKIGGKNDNLFTTANVNTTVVYKPDVQVKRMGYDGTTEVSKSSFVWVREFFLNTAELEGQCGFAVLEDTDGNLHLGEYIGD